MKKRFFIVLCAFFAAIGILVLPISASSAAGADKFMLLFDTKGAFIAENPTYTSEANSKPWLLIGKDVFMTDNGGYPAPFDNEHESAAFYYLAGSNSIEWLRHDESYTDKLAEDYVIEYVVQYGDGAVSPMSVCIAYNYDYYIEVYIAPSGCGDISIVRGSGSISMLDSSSTLDASDPADLISALGGEGGSLPEELAVSIKVELDEDRMPHKIEVYVNGLAVGVTSAGFGESVDNLTPVYSDDLGGVFPTDKLGDIVALKFASGAYGEVQSIYIYTAADGADKPNLDTQRYYAERYGNASFDFDAYEQAAEENGNDLADNIIDYDVITKVALVFGVASAVIIILALVILIVRKKDR